MRKSRFALGALAAFTLGSPLLANRDVAPLYTEILGVREFTGMLIARPVQAEAWSQRGLSSAEAEAMIADARVLMAEYSQKRYVPQTDEYVIYVPAGETENSMAQRLMGTGLFQYVEPNYMVFPTACPNDGQFNSQYHHQANIMDSCAAWDIHTGNPTVGIGICDTGVRTTHQDLLLNRLEGYNAVDERWESEGGQIIDINGHGTATTGCAAANGNNGVGVSGVGWNLSHRMIRVSNSSGGGSSYDDLQHGARTSIEAGDKVASLSYSGVDSNSNLTTATYIKSIGGLMVYAAGNEARNLSLSNRDADDIIVPGATDINDALAWFSNYGQMVDVVAPGVDVFTTSNGSNSAYGPASGTSFSCPLTAGLIGLIWSADPSLTPDEVEDILKSGVQDLGASGVDNTFGYGRIDSLGSLNLLGGGDPFVLSVPTLTGGQQATLSVTGATANDNVYFIYSLTGFGSTFVPGLGISLDLNNPQLGGTDTADGSGNASLTTTIPNGASGRTLYLQAAEVGAKTNAESAVVN